MNDPEENNDYTLMTVQELNDLYGAENVQISDELHLLDTDVIAVSMKPCDGFSPFGGALAQERHDAQQLANECCCIGGFGVICCQPSSGAFIAIDGIAVPTKCD